MAGGQSIFYSYSQVLHQNDWAWVGNRLNFSRYENWLGGKPTCHPSCFDMFGVMLKSPTMKWSPVNRGVEYPYICQSGCSLGYVWRVETRRCVKVLADCLHSLISLYLISQHLDIIGIVVAFKNLPTIS